MQPSILILGAGAAGLAAAAKLIAAGWDVTLLEARERLGGRIHTIRRPGFPPLEAGPEFLHGDRSSLTRLIGLEQQTLSGPLDQHWRAGKASPRVFDFAAVWSAVVARMKRYAGPDLSFHQFLAQCCFDLPAEDRRIATEYVEGFNAADAREISLAWLRRTEVEVGEASQEPVQRLTSGFDQLLRSLQAGAASARHHLQTRVTRVRWRPGQVTVDACHRGRLVQYAGTKILLTLPLGVLQARLGETGYVEFLPPLPKQRALARLRMGSVVKVVLSFEQPLWQERGIRGFLHVPDARFLTWWPWETTNTVTGWSGGPRAEGLSTLDDGQVLDAALCELAAGLALPSSRLRDILRGAQVFNWQRDPFSRGAYSFAAVNGAIASRELATPVAGTLFFAGEATDELYAATVTGAIRSGRRAADEILAQQQSLRTF